MKTKKKALVFVFILFSFPLYASFNFNTTCKEAYTDIICLRFDKANRLLLSEKKLNPGNQIPCMLDHYIDFLKVMIGEQEKDFLELKNNSSNRLQVLAKSSQESPWFLHSQALIYLQTGFARIKFGEYINAALDINTSYRLLEKNKAKFPGFTPGKTLLGFIHVVIGTLPSKYSWAFQALRFKGSIAQGITELNEAFSSQYSDPELSFLLPGTAFLLTFIQLNLANDATNIPSLETRLTKFLPPAILKESPLLLYLQADIFKHANMNDEVITVLSSYRRDPTVYPSHYLNYQLGVAKMNRLDPDANYPFIDFVGSYKGKNYIKSAYLYLSWYYALHGNDNQYNTYMNRIKLRGETHIDNDREALNAALKNEKPDANLLKARLLFDGGYYEKAESALLNYKPSGKENELEYVYRLGRIYDKWGKPENALIYYNKTIAQGENQPNYYAANAALQLGILNEKARNYAMARKYFEKVLAMDFHEYEFSIKNKAESGLKRLQGK